MEIPETNGDKKEITTNKIVTNSTALRLRSGTGKTTVRGRLRLRSAWRYAKSLRSSLVNSASPFSKKTL
jgi:hypothetical protein